MRKTRERPRQLEERDEVDGLKSAPASGSRCNSDHIPPGAEYGVTSGAVFIGRDDVTAELEVIVKRARIEGSAARDVLTWTAASAALVVVSAGVIPQPGC